MRYIALALAALATTACVPQPHTFQDWASRGTDDAPQILRGSGPPDADPDACYAQEVTPAVYETVTEQVMLQPPQITTDGAVLAPAVFVTETQQRIVVERRELWFQTPCDMDQDPEFVASLQRALQARGHYRGQITGIMDARTSRAIRAYQAPEGLDSAVLSLAAARQLGLTLWDPELTNRANAD